MKKHLNQMWSPQVMVVGLGFMGEQGAESIHARFNTTRRSYVTTPNPVNRLEAITKEHLNSNSPTGGRFVVENLARELSQMATPQLLCLVDNTRSTYL